MTLDQLHRRQVDIGPLQFFEPVAEEPPGNQMLVRAGWIKVEGQLIQKADQLTVGFSVVPTADHVRWDLVWLDFNGVVNVTPGSNQFSTVPMYTGAPQPPPHSYPVAYVFVNEAGSVVVTEADITDFRPKLNFLFDSDFSDEYSIDDGDKPHEALSKLSLESRYHEEYTGKEVHGRGSHSPEYTLHTAPEYAVADGQHLTEAAGRLDKEAERIKTFSGKDNVSQSSPLYGAKGAPEYAITDGDALTQAIAYIDTELNRIKQYAGKDNLSQALPDYSPWTTHTYIGVGDPLDTGIGKLDAALAVTGGKIKQVLIYNNSAYLYPVGIAWVPVVSGAITPSSAGHRILVLGFTNCHFNSNTNTFAYLDIVRGAAHMAQTKAYGGHGVSNNNTGHPMSMGFVDSPGTAAPVTYSLQVSSQNPGTAFHVNSANSINGNVLILMEIA